MELMMLLRLLWRRRILVAVGAVLAAAVALVMGHGATPASGVAKTGVVIDTPSSLLATDLPANAATLPWRATVLGMLLGAPEERAGMAREAGIADKDLAVLDAELVPPTVPASLPRAATEAAAELTEPYVLTVHTDNSLPIVWLEAAAPTPAAAKRLTEAAVRALQAGASPQSTPELQGLNIRPVGAIHVRAIPGGPGRKKLAVLAVVVFALWLVALTAGPLLRGIARSVRMQDPAGATR